MPSRSPHSSRAVRASASRWWAAAAIVLIGAFGLMLMPAILRAAPARSATPASRCSSVPFRRFDGGYSYFRIPAVVRTTGGVLLAFAEARANGGGDSGDIDLVLRRSRDGGCTWGKLTLVADHGTNTIGNPAPIYDSVTKQVVMLATGNGGRVTERMMVSGETTPATARRVYRLTSSNDGVTWSEREITASVKRKGWRWYATGPGHGIQISGGRYDGRLVVTGVHSAAPVAPARGADHRYSGTQAIVSDDHGRTWRLGFVDRTYDGRINTNETSVAQLSSGKLYFNARDQLGTAPGNRAFGYSATGGNTLSGGFVSAPHVATPMVQCSVLGLGNRLYFAGPSAMDGTRSRITLRSATDDGVSGRFTAQHMIWGNYSAYSDLVALAPSTIGILYERGQNSAYDEIAFNAVSTSELTPL